MDLSSLPIHYQAVIPESYLDRMGHMNVMWYTHLFSCATGGLFGSIGLNLAYFEANHAGTFALEQHARFRVEVRHRPARDHSNARLGAVGQAVPLHAIHVQRRRRQRCPRPWSRWAPT